jgi:predicted MFS family arabinose efflux permease
MNQILIFSVTFIIQFIIAMEMNFIGPLAPFLAVYFGIRDSQVIYFNLGYSAVGLLVPFFGVWADKYGNKRLISYALALFMAGCILSAFSASALTFAFGRIFIGLGYFSLSGTTMSYISEFVDYKKRGMAAGILRIAFGVAIFVSPLYTSYLTEKFNTLKSIYLPLAFLAMAALILLQKLPETKVRESSQLDLKEFVTILKHPRTVKVLTSLFLIITAPTMLYNFLAIHLSRTFGMDQGEIGMAYSIIAVGTIAGIAVAAVLADRIGKLRFSRYLFGFMVIALVPIAYVQSSIMVVVLASFFAFGLDGGWTAYQAFSSEIQPEKRGTFLSLFYTVNAITITLYSIIGPFLFDLGGLRLTTALGLFASSIALLILFRLSRSPA